MSGQVGGLDFGSAYAAGHDLAKELVTIATSHDLGDIREDATIEALARVVRKTDSGMWGVTLAETVKMLAVALAVYADLAAGRDPMNPTGGTPCHG
ncbi:hypothetical protein ACXR2T_06285 [Leucobacter sp. HY1910]